ncbi:hypothetical protein VNO77_03596 [Canavalia gladiata]|uniref:Uncharacterized protein n=1 Tax=Canavalia gladiata TaxID=3824 RepID=A0AAN9MVL9_CANGL
MHLHPTTNPTPPPSFQYSGFILKQAKRTWGYCTRFAWENKDPLNLRYWWAQTFFTFPALRGIVPHFNSIYACHHALRAWISEFPHWLFTLGIHLIMMYLLPPDLNTAPGLSTCLYTLFRHFLADDDLHVCLPSPMCWLERYGESKFLELLRKTAWSWYRVHTFDRLGIGLILGAVGRVSSQSQNRIEPTSANVRVFLFVEVKLQWILNEAGSSFLFLELESYPLLESGSFSYCRDRDFSSLFLGMSREMTNRRGLWVRMEAPVNEKAHLWEQVLCRFLRYLITCTDGEGLVQIGKKIPSGPSSAKSATVIGSTFEEVAGLSWHSQMEIGCIAKIRH